MKSNTTILIDPLQNEVHLTDCLKEMLTGQGYKNADLGEVIRKPAMAFKTTKPEYVLYHLRSIEWGLTVLLKSEWKNNYWLATDLFCNPETSLISKLLAESRISFVYPRN